MAYQLRLLGGARIEGEQGPVHGRAAHRRRLGLLAILALSPRRTAARDRVAALLWSEHPTESARRLLSESMYVLRRELGDDAIVAAGDELSLGETIATDVGEFLGALADGRLADAVAAYAGPLLDGWYVSDAPEFERWADEERRRLAGLHQDALRRLAEDAERRGEWREAIARWRELARLDPYSSPVALHLATVLCETGEDAGALQALAAHEAILKADLDVSPSAEVRALMARLRTVAAPAAVARSAAPRPGGETVAAVATPPAHTAFVPTSPVPVEVSDVAVAATVPPVAAPAVPTPSVTAAAATRTTRRPLRQVLMALVTMAVLVPLVAMGGAELVERWQGRLGPELGVAAYSPQRIAVLYFDDHSKEQDLGYLADGLTEGLIHQLSGVGALQVVSRNGVKRFRRQDAPFDSIVSSLRVGTIVEGSVQRSGDSVRVTVQLIDAARGTHLSSRTIDRPLTEVLALQDELAMQVSAFLRQRLGEEIRLRDLEVGTRSAVARDLLLRADQKRNDAWTLAWRDQPSDVRSRLRITAEADSLYALASAADEDWARPLLGRGWLALRRARLEVDAPAESLGRRAVAFADSAIVRDERSAEAYELRGTALWYMAELDSLGPPSNRRPMTDSQRTSWLADAERDLREAIAIDSTQAGALAMLSKVVRLTKGAAPEAEILARRALEMDAYLENAGDVVDQLFRAAYWQGDGATARQWCEYGRQLIASDWRFVECQLTLLSLDPRQADPARAWELARQLERMDPRPITDTPKRRYQAIFRWMAAAAVAAAHSDWRDSARAVLDRSIAETSRHRPSREDLYYDEVLVRYGLGDVEGARRALAGYLKARPQYRELVERDPTLRPILPALR